MKVSVLVIAGTGRPYLAEALRSLVNQDFQDWEAIVIEACAVPSDIAEVERQIREVNDPRVRVFSYDGARGYPPYASRKWNFALTHATGDFIAFLDDDDMKERNWLSAMREPLLSNPNLLTTACNGWTINEVGAVRGELFNKVSLDYTSLILCNFVTTGQLVVRRSVLDEVGRFDEDLSCSEDYDLCLRLAKYPWQVVSSTRCLKRDLVDNACYKAAGWTQTALRRIIAKHGAPYTCHGCGRGFPNQDESFVWCVDGVGFRNWHYDCTGLRAGV